MTIIPRNSKASYSWIYQIVHDEMCQALNTLQKSIQFGLTIIKSHLQEISSLFSCQNTYLHVDLVYKKNKTKKLKN